MTDTSTEDARRDAAWEALKADMPNWSFGGSDRWVFGEAWKRAMADRDAAVARSREALRRIFQKAVGGPCPACADVADAAQAEWEALGEEPRP